MKPINAFTTDMSDNLNMDSTTTEKTIKNLSKPTTTKTIDKEILIKSHQAYDALLVGRGATPNYDDNQEFMRQVLRLFYPSGAVDDLSGDSLITSFEYFYLNRDKLFNDDSEDIQNDSGSPEISVSTPGRDKMVNLLSGN